MTHQLQQEEGEKVCKQQDKEGVAFSGCMTAIFLFIGWVYSAWLAPDQWRWFVVLTFILLVSIIEILKVERKKL